MAVIHSPQPYIGAPYGGCLRYARSVPDGAAHDGRSVGDGNNYRFPRRKKGGANQVVKLCFAIFIVVLSS